MNTVEMKVADEIVGGWDPAGQAIAGAQTGKAAGDSLLGPLGGIVGGALGLIGGFITGALSA